MTIKHLSIILMTLVLCLFSTSAKAEDTNDVKIQKAIALIDNGAIDTAIQLLNEVVSTDANNTHGLYELGLAYSLKNEYDKAIEIFNKLTKSEECNDQIYAMLGNCYDMKGDIENAMKAYEKGIEQFPESGFLYNELGTMALRDNAHPAKAYESYLMGIAKSPDFSPCYYRAAFMALTDGYLVDGLIYGEMYIAMEKENGARLKRIGQLMNRAFYDLASNKNYEIVDNLHPNRIIDKNFYLKHFQKAISSMEDGVDSTDKLCEAIKVMHTNILADELMNDNTTPYKKHLRAVRESGTEDAYIRLVVAASDVSYLNQWAKQNGMVWNQFADWINSYKPDLK